MIPLRKTIQNKLVDLGRGTDFKIMQFDSSGKASVSLKTLRPKSVIADELSSSFGESRNERRSRKREKTNWRWTLELTFSQTVNFEEFEKSLSEDPPRIKRTVDTGQVTLLLEDAEYAHPPQSAPNTGSSVTYTLSAELIN